MLRKVQLYQCVILAVSALGLPQFSLAASDKATVVLSQSCDYVLLDSRDGMILVKHLKGTQPSPGDTLRGNLEAGEFSDLQNTANQEQLNVWVDMVDPSSNRALSEYGRYCS